MAQRNESLDRILVITPTYNEAENLAPIIKRLRDAVPSAHSLIADDNSPDGTGAIANRMAAEDPAIHVLASRGSRLPTSPGSRGAWSATTTSWSRWTPTARTSQSCSHRCWRHSTTWTLTW